jgi:hypothetical protein
MEKKRMKRRSKRRKNVAPGASREDKAERAFKAKRAV